MHEPFARQHAPLGCGHETPAHDVESPWYPPPCPAHAASVASMHEPFARQHAPLGCGHETPAHDVESPWYPPPCPAHAASVASMHEPFARQHAPLGWAHETPAHEVESPWYRTALSSARGFGDFDARAVRQAARTARLWARDARARCRVALVSAALSSARGFGHFDARAVRQAARTARLWARDACTRCRVALVSAALSRARGFGRLDARAVRQTARTARLGARDACARGRVALVRTALSSARGLGHFDARAVRQAARTARLRARDACTRGRVALVSAALSHARGFGRLDARAVRQAARTARLRARDARARCRVALVSAALSSARGFSDFDARAVRQAARTARLGARHSSAGRVRSLPESALNVLAVGKRATVDARTVGQAARPGDQTVLIRHHHRALGMKAGDQQSERDRSFEAESAVALDGGGERSRSDEDVETGVDDLHVAAGHRDESKAAEVRAAEQHAVIGLEDRTVRTGKDLVVAHVDARTTEQHREVARGTHLGRLERQVNGTVLERHIRTDQPVDGDGHLLEDPRSPHRVELLEVDLGAARRERKRKRLLIDVLRRRTGIGIRFCRCKHRNRAQADEPRCCLRVHFLDPPLDTPEAGATRRDSTPRTTATAGCSGCEFLLLPRFLPSSIRRICGSNCKTNV